MTNAARLLRLLCPKTVAVVGGGIWGRAVIDGLRQFGFAGQVWAVHPKLATMGDAAVVGSIKYLPQPPDAVFLGINRDATILALAELAAMGAGGAVCFASGFAETADGQGRQSALIEAAGDMPILGPNCYGFLNALDQVAVWPDVHGLKPVERGVAIVTQSSNIALNLTMQARGLPLAYVTTAGNQAQVSLADLGQALLQDPRVTALGLHIEGFGDIPAFEALAKTAWSLGKPIVVLKAGRSEVARQAAISHTASLAGSDAGADALLRRLGMARVAGLGAFLETLALFHQTGALPKGGIAALSCSGGEASLVADLSEARGICFAPLRSDQSEGLKRVLGDLVTVANPLDYHTFIWGDVPAMTQTFATMVQGDAAITLIVVDFPRADRCDTPLWDTLIEAACAAQQQTGGRLALVSSLPETLPEDLTEKLVACGLICLHGLDDALDAIRAAQMIHAPAEKPVLPAWTINAGAQETLTETQAKVGLAAFGVPVPTGGLAACPEATKALAVGPGPYVVKSTGQAHKSETGGVVLGLPDAAAVAKAAAQMPGPVHVEQHITDGLAELLVGVVADPAHGMVLTLGAGGILTELWQDSQSLLLPVTDADIHNALQTLRIWPLLTGYRGKAPADIAAIIAAVQSIAAYVQAHKDQVLEVEVNPLIVSSTNAIAADALITRLAQTGDAT